MRVRTRTKDPSTTSVHRRRPQGLRPPPRCSFRPIDRVHITGYSTYTVIGDLIFPVGVGVVRTLLPFPSSSSLTGVVSKGLSLEDPTLKEDGESLVGTSLRPFGVDVSTQEGCTSTEGGAERGEGGVATSKYFTPELGKLNRFKVSYE